MNTFKIAIAFALTVSAALAQIVTPQGRLTLDAFTPVMTGDVTGATTVWYLPYVGNTIPISNSTSCTFVNEPIIGIIDLGLNSSAHLAGKIYDVFAFMNSGQATLGAGPAWTNFTTRSAAINTSYGVVTNEFAITLTNGSNTYSNIPISEATYLGSFYATANGETSMQFKPTPASGGSANILGLYNAYNRVQISSFERDSTTSWSMASATAFETLNNGTGGGTGNSISFLDGLQQSVVTASMYIYVNSNGFAEVGMLEDLTSGTPNIAAGIGTSSGALSLTTAIEETFPPLMGFHYIQAMQLANGATANFYGAGDNLQALIASLEM